MIDHTDVINVATFFEQPKILQRIKYFTYNLRFINVKVV
jgi:hypothetical protein